LHINNEETFNCNIEERENKYFIKVGEYKWPSGQKYVGNFVINDLNVGTLHFPKGYSFKEEFKDGKIKKGEFKSNDFVYTNEEFKDGILEGESIIQKDISRVIVLMVNQEIILRNVLLKKIIMNMKFQISILNIGKLLKNIDYKKR